MQFYIGKESDFNQRLVRVEFEMQTVERQLPTPIKISSWGWLAGAGGRSPSPAQSVASGDQATSDVMSLIEGLDAPNGGILGGVIGLPTQTLPGNREERVKKWSGMVKGFKFGVKPSAVLSPEALKAVAKKMGQVKAKLQEIYIFFDDLTNYLETNKEGFRKSLKKYDKVCKGKGNLHETFWPKFEDSYHMSERKAILDQAKTQVVDNYAILFFNGSLTKAKGDLERYKRQQIEVERNTVWKDMVAIERMRGNAALKEGLAFESNGPLGWIISQKSPISFVLALGVFAVLLSIDVSSSRTGNILYIHRRFLCFSFGLPPPELPAASPFLTPSFFQFMSGALPRCTREAKLPRPPLLPISPLGHRGHSSLCHLHHGLTSCCPPPRHDGQDQGTSLKDERPRRSPLDISSHVQLNHHAPPRGVLHCICPLKALYCQAACHSGYEQGGKSTKECPTRSHVCCSLRVNVYLKRSCPCPHLHNCATDSEESRYQELIRQSSCDGDRPGFQCRRND